MDTEEKYYYPRPHLPIDDRDDGEASALDVASSKPSYRFRAYRQTKRKLQELEIMREIFDKKSFRNITKEELKEIINS